MKEIAALLDLRGNAAIVTGGGVGIGFACALRLAEAGADVVVADISLERAEKAAAAIAERGFTAAAVRSDVSNERDVHAMIDRAVEAFGRLDILVNNAGIYPTSLVADMDPAEFDRVIAVNLRGVYLCIRAAAARMVDQGEGGRIINVTSIDAIHPSSAGLAHYDASKHGVWGFTKNVALELAPHGISVNAVAPGAIATPGVDEARQRTQGQAVDMEALQEAFLARIPMHRMGDQDEIATVVLFLASDMASYMTGSHIVADGGVLLT